ncbi:ABC transporter ATP-binding protein [Planctomycetota bacterium]
MKKNNKTNSTDIAIKVENISKCYRIGLKENLYDNLGDAVLNFLKSPLHNYRKYRSLYKFNRDELSANADPINSHDDIIWALSGIDFTVERGEVLGIIGRNGAGKSTLLKILSRITEPTTGCAEVAGKVSSLLEVGTGFHPELSGRENVYLNGAILGMKKKEMDRKFDRIVEFSGVEKFIDTPVKRYSSGMKVRLAFSVAAHLEPDILIIDEVLAVGDAEFQTKCLGKMQNIVSQGRTVLFVSHNMGAIMQLCPRAILLDKGTVAATGPSKEIVEKYLSGIFSPVDNMDLINAPVRNGDGRLRFVATQLRCDGGQATCAPVSGSAVDIVIDFVSEQSLSSVQFKLTIFNQMGIAVTHCSVETSQQRFSVGYGKGRIVCHIPKLPLPLGQYKVAVAAYDDLGKLDWVPTACIFNVEASNFFEMPFVPPMRYSTALVEHCWKLMTTNGDKRSFALKDHG